MRKDTAVAAVVGAVVGAVFGRVWWSWAGEGVPAWQSALDGVGWVVLSLFVIAGAGVLVTSLRSPGLASPGGPPPHVRRQAWFGLVIPVEIALIVLGQNLLDGRLGHPEWAPVWTMLVVGAHFLPFAWILGVRAFGVLAGVLCSVAVLSALAAAAAGGGALWLVLPGFGGAAVLWVFAGWALTRVARGRWADAGVV